MSIKALGNSIGLIRETRFPVMNKITCKAAADVEGDQTYPPYLLAFADRYRIPVLYGFPGTGFQLIGWIRPGFLLLEYRNIYMGWQNIRPRGLISSLDPARSWGSKAVVSPTPPYWLCRIVYTCIDERRHRGSYVVPVEYNGCSCGDGNGTGNCSSGRNISTLVATINLRANTLSSLTLLEEYDYSWSD